MPDTGIAKRKTELHREIEWNKRVVSLLRWEYSEKQNLMEIEIEVTNKEFDKKNNYEFSVMESNGKRLKVDSILVEPDWIIVQVRNVPKRFRELSLHMGIENDDNEGYVRFYTNKNDALLNNTISVQDASKIIDASDSVEEQEEMMQQIQEKGDAKQVINEAKFNKDKIKEAERIIAQDREKNDKPVTSDFFGNSTNEHKIDLKEFKSDIKAITRLLSKDERILDSNELMAYYNHIRGLEEILKVNK